MAHISPTLLHDEALSHCKTVAPYSEDISPGSSVTSSIELFIIPDDGYAIRASDFENRTIATYNNYPDLFFVDPNDWLHTEWGE